MCRIVVYYEYSYISERFHLFVLLLVNINDYMCIKRIDRYETRRKNWQELE